MLLVAAILSLHSMHHHFKLHQSSLASVTRLKLQVQHASHLTFQHTMRSYLEQTKATALHNQAVKLEDKLQAEDLEILQEQEVEAEYEDFFDQVQQEIQECHRLIERQEEISKQAHEQAQAFLDEMYNLEYEFAQTCAAYHVVQGMCETIARFNGLEHKVKSLALNALYKEEAAYAAEEKETLDEQLELELEKNATVYKELEQEAQQNVTRLENEYNQDEEHEEHLEDGATALFRQSRLEREMAVKAHNQTEQYRVELDQVTRTASSQAKWARLYAILAFFLTVAVLYVFGKYLLILIKKRRPVTDKLDDYDDGVTVALSEVSEESPLMVDHQDAAPYEIHSVEESYSTIDLQSRSTVSSLSPMTHGARCQWNTRVMPTMKRWLPTIEIIAVVVVLVFAVKALLFEIIPVMHKL